ncbi:MAG: hypothetical protein QM764_20565 [Chitinophagaceae bacterium]
MSNHFISLEDAKTMTSLYLTKKEDILDPAYRGQDILFNSETFDRDAFDVILGRTGAKGIRIYLGMDPSYQVRAIAVATDNSGHDILPAAGTPASAGYIVEVGVKCPPQCPPPPPPDNLE